MGRAKFLGLLAGIPVGLVYFFTFGFYFWRSLAVGFLFASLYSILAGIFLTVTKLPRSLALTLMRTRCYLESQLGGVVVCQWARLRQ
jgi:hypothetical protein